MSQLEFRRSLRIVTLPKPGEATADAIEYAIGFGVLLLPNKLHAPQIICHEMVRRSLEDRIEILISRLVLSQRNVDIGPAQ